ncbi:MAG: hypothetical protein ACJAYU_001345, partial [Bradymonadia bacterium]
MSKAHVEYRGISERGGSARHSNTDGRFQSPVNPNSKVAVWAVYRGDGSQSIEIETPGVGSDLDIGAIGAISAISASGASGAIGARGAIGA